MLSLPRANYLTSAAAGLPLMLVRLLVVSCTAVTYGVGCNVCSAIGKHKPSACLSPRSQSFGAISTWTIYLANSLYVEAKRRKVCSQSRTQSRVVVLQGRANRLSAQPMLPPVFWHANPLRFGFCSLQPGSGTRPEPSPGSRPPSTSRWLATSQTGALTCIGVTVTQSHPVPHTPKSHDGMCTPMKGSSTVISD